MPRDAIFLTLSAPPLQFPVTPPALLSPDSTFASVITTVNDINQYTTKLVGNGQLAVTANAAFDTNVLFVDAVNNRVGIVNSTPGHVLRVDGTTSLNGAVNALSTLGVTGIATFAANVTTTGTLTANIVVLQGALSANGSNGTATHVLTTNGSGVYWAAGGGGGASANSTGGNGAIQFYNGSNLGSSSKLIVADDGYASKIAVGNATANVTMHGWYLWGPALIANSGSTTIILGAENNTYDGSDNGSNNSGKLQGNSISLQSRTGTVAIFKTIQNITTSDYIHAYDAGKLLRCNSASASSLYFTAENGGGSYIETTMLGAKWYLFQEGAGQISVMSDGAPGGLTILFRGPTTTTGQYSLLTAELITANATHREFATTLSYPSTASPTFAGLTISGYSTVQGLLEKATIASTRANGTINFDTSTQSVVFYTANTANNWTLNLRGNSSTTLNAVMSTGQSLTLVFAVTNGSTAYYANAHQIDGANVTPKWQDGAAPFAGSANAVDVYVYTVIKTAASTYTLLGSRTKFA